ncbi:SAM-dependent methyltransferase [Actinomadura graeca]|uniref:SAM-dependent methyltransferase n=1 Tax=Actinomadura graeca TaxID=2750812 RepID=A0ABX8QRL8_9ACTN|nr:SAM-dependent methyltransferase [Actinomadura graeca]QXJ21315.1 SAM-dependent methyltransferase [Actinomadura graeca]
MAIPVNSGSVLDLSRWAVASFAEDAHRHPGSPAGPAWPGSLDGSSAPAPSAARMNDYLLGGKDNYAADREMAEWALLKAPVISRLVRAGREFARHAVGHLAREAGLRQFIDVGCGLPGTDGVAGAVRASGGACRVGYVDNDPMVIAHARALLAVDAGTCAVAADVRDPAGLLAHPELLRVIDPDRPAGLLLFGVLDHLTDEDDPGGVLAGLVAGLAPGSHVALTHAERTPALDTVAVLLQEAGVPFTPRGPDEIAGICAGLEKRAGLEMLDDSGEHPPIISGGDPLPLTGFIGRKPE